MNESIELIDQILQEHASIMKDVDDLEQIASDSGALQELNKADKNFSPGRLDKAEGLKKLQQSLEKSETGLLNHFGHEETALMEVFKKHGNSELISDFHTLLLQHEEIKQRFDLSKKQATQLASGEISAGHWNATANDMLAYMNKTRKLIEEHASSERQLFRALRNELSKG